MRFEPRFHAPHRPVARRLEHVSILRLDLLVSTTRRSSTASRSQVNRGQSSGAFDFGLVPDRDK